MTFRTVPTVTNTHHTARSLTKHANVVSALAKYAVAALTEACHAKVGDAVALHASPAVSLAANANAAGAYSINACARRCLYLKLIGWCLRPHADVTACGNGHWCITIIAKEAQRMIRFRSKPHVMRLEAYAMHFGEAAYLD